MPNDIASEQDILNTFSKVRECDYKGEHYSVRDNGAVMRHTRSGKRQRKDDYVWTFGVRDPKTAYMYIGPHRVHIIVANAFLGARDSTVYVVDHIDTNRCNNRVSNLRWFTRLENALNNPVTRKRIEWLCGGDIMKFIENPSCLNTEDKRAQDISWMRTVTKEEARIAYENVMKWAGIKNDYDKKLINGESEKHSDNNWMFKPGKYQKVQFTDQEYDDIVEAKHPSCAIQYKWRTPTDFLMCPEDVTDDTLEAYAGNLEVGRPFSRNDWGESILEESLMSTDGRSLVVRTSSSSPAKPGGFVVKMYVKGKRIVHENCGSFFTEEGAIKVMTVESGREWTGPETFDDLCG